MIEVELPDGRVVEIETDDPKAAATAAKKFMGAKEEPTVSGLLDKYKSIGRGVVRGLKDFEDGSVQLMGRGMKALAPSGSSAESFLSGEVQKNEAKMKAGQEDYTQRRLGTGFDVPRLAGNVVAGLPIALAAPATLAGATGVGAVTGAMQPVDVKEGTSYWKEKGLQTALGGASSLAGAAATKGISRVLNPKSSPEVQALMKEGVRPTPGQMLGGAAQRIEEGATSIPLLGDAVKSAQRRAVNDFNRAAINKALAPIGQKLDGKTLIGREAIEEAGNKVSQAYDDLLPKMTFSADQKFVADVTNLRSMAQNLTKEGAEQFDRILKNEVVSKINTNTGLASGETLKRMESVLGQKAASYSKSAIASERELGDALKQLQSTIRETVARSNPAQAETLSKINNAYAQLLRVENAAGRVGSKDGVFSPNALNAAARQMDNSLRKRAFAQGNAMTQDFAEAGQKVLGSKVPDSGTPFRALTGAGLLTGGAGMLSVPAGVGAGAAMLPYTPMGQNAMAHILASRPEVSRFLGRGLDKLSPFVGAAMAPYGASFAPRVGGLFK